MGLTLRAPSDKTPTSTGRPTIYIIGRKLFRIREDLIKSLAHTKQKVYNGPHTPSVNELSLGLLSKLIMA